MASVIEDAREPVTPEVAKPKFAGFWALIATQFQGAFSDNTLKWLVSFLVLETATSKEERDLWFVLIVPLLFSVPFLLFSIPGGFLADKYSKRSVTIGTVVGQLVVMALAAWALAQGRWGWAGVALFLMSTLGAIFGPTKYGLLPELLPESRLSWGNGIIEFGTLLAAILAALAGGYLAHVFHGRQVWSGVIFLVLSVVGLLISLAISRVPPADPGRKFDWNVPREFFSEVRHINRDRPLLTAVVANTFFWFLGSLLLLNIVLYGADILHLDETRSSYLLAGLSMGIGLGSLAAGFVSGKKIQMGMVLPGLGGILVMAGLLSWPGIGFGSVLFFLIVLGFAGGFFVVPINALIQRRPSATEKGRTIAVANMLSFIGVTLQPVAQFVMLRLGHPDPSKVFLIAGAMSVVMGLVLVRMWPELWGRALDWTRLHRRTTL
ncbi:MAG: acyl-[acyl-carrier-protein]-phospholipid O-acyltransferase [Acidobacteriaceae bacterium]|jgi:acyl-[acyl-carrier-protein]-phospholipid O-acyltransferase/long-chain-fatty-acid--[acyl-carrier-protein] ligase|nr:acyl-[acyl-carrier-protein]-phospholipid O-acyltransferase [Acidobacteriaceae bacterium]